MLTSDQVSQFKAQGFLVLKQLFSPGEVKQIRDISVQHLNQRVAPFELESDLQYPGAPAAEHNGAHTIRRLKQAYDRDPSFQSWCRAEPLTAAIRQLIEEPIYLVRAHHNCVMTKLPEFSSDSLWHQDLRYWSYSKGNLVSAWLALGPENLENGCLQVIPGSHRRQYQPDQFDDASFFKQELAINQTLLKNKVAVTLNPGDVTLFHCRLLHAATRNHTEQPKLAAVYTYRGLSDRPVEGSRSASLPDVEIG